jgi:elongation factor P--beta-lysine ligase
VVLYQSAECHIPEEWNLHEYRCEILESHSGSLAEAVEYIFTFPDFLLKKLISYEHSNTDFSVCEVTVCIPSLFLRELNIIRSLEL